MQLLNENAAFEVKRSYLSEMVGTFYHRIIITALVIHGPLSYEIAGLGGNDIIHAAFQSLR